MSGRQFAADARPVVFLNTARAQLHDTDALVDALRSGHLRPPASTTSGGDIWPTTIRCSMIC